VEAAERQKEAAEEFKELKRLLAEQHKEVAEAQKKTDRAIEATNKQLGKLGGRYGETVEAVVLPNLVGKFRKLGFVFTKAYRGATIKDEENRLVAEIDITLENGDKVMIVEVTSKPTTEDVNDHIKRMQKVRRHADLHGDKRKFLGAVAGMVVNDDMRDCILGHGFYVIVPSGETFNITVPEGKYQPREW
jgi:CBS domain-containing protein